MPFVAPSQLAHGFLAALAGVSIAVAAIPAEAFAQG